MEQESLLTGLEFNPVLASAGKRLLNFFIDFFIFYTLIILIVFAIVVNTASPDGFGAYKYPNYNPLFQYIVFKLISLMLYIFFYFLCELLFKGRTIGKLITGTRVVNEDGTNSSAKTILLRSLCRIVPFEPFSAFGGYPWHDKWARTFVIDIKKTALQNPMLQV